jgi:hypothetical protein
MKHWTRNVFLGSHDLQERLRTEIVRRWPEAQYPFHIQVVADDATSTIEVRVWTDDGIHIFEEATHEAFAASRENDPINAVLDAVELGLKEVATESLAINRGVPS